MLIYVSGPYTHGDVMENIRNACLVGDALLEMGHTPIVPHLNGMWQLISPKPYDTWLQYDKQVLDRCGLMVRLPGHSPGADVEEGFARENEIPVVHLSNIRADYVRDVVANAINFDMWD
jgi:hypothetical protein